MTTLMHAITIFQNIFEVASDQAPQSVKKAKKKLASEVSREVELSSSSVYRSARFVRRIFMSFLPVSSPQRNLFSGYL